MRGTESPICSNYVTVIVPLNNERSDRMKNRRVLRGAKLAGEEAEIHREECRQIIEANRIKLRRIHEKYGLFEFRRKRKER